MNTSNAFTIYNAAAGAGKTYTLVKSYLITLLQGDFKESYKNILAITFTNKAVSEMKSRVLESLGGISVQETPTAYQEILKDIVLETGLDEPVIKKKADRVLKSILHNYAAFDIVTIDTFTHRIIRTFAKDLGIPLNFEIEMDTGTLIQESVDALIAKIGVDESLTNTIIQFAISKLEDDKSWDITIELNKIASLLFSENHKKHLQILYDKSVPDFERLRISLRSRIKILKEEVITTAHKILEVFTTQEIADGDFTRASIPLHFKKLSNGDTGVDYKAIWKQNIETTSFYSAKLEVSKKEKIDALRPSIEKAFLNTKALLLEFKLLHNILKNLVPLSVLQAIHKELQEIQKERNILLISEFNTIISEAIQDQPAPFIYERLGERYRDYFIDEFQDTSTLQWTNMIPLIDNAISTETLTGKRGKLTIVGDAKQAIYRWRGGKAEQFIALSVDENPFSIEEKEVINLPKNYRSHKEIISFNNSLFTFLSNDFSDPMHQALYETGNKQEYNTKKGGYVSVSFAEADNVTEENEIYPQRTYEAILELREKGYPLHDICILTRRQKEGASIADFLTEQGIQIISSEILLLKNDPRVCFSIDIFKYCINPDDLLSKTQMLYYLAERFTITKKHDFLKKMVFATHSVLSTELLAFGIHFNFQTLRSKPFYDAVEYVIDAFSLGQDTPAYLQFFLDVVFAYTQKYTYGMAGFLSYWEQKKDSLSIVAPDGKDAVQMMTIHKSKGLEFPCVIYPYANIDIYRELEPKTWLPVSPEKFEGFEEVFVNYNKELAGLGGEAEHIVIERQSQLELDALNLLYVALTRAEEQLYIISKLEMNAKGEINPHKFSGKLIQYLQHTGTWNNSVAEYTFGASIKPNKVNNQTHQKANTLQLSSFQTSQKKRKIQIATNSGKVWDTHRETAIEKGNLIHNLMASVFTPEDIEKVVQKSYESGEIDYSEKELLYSELKKVVSHPVLAPYFEKKYFIFNEKDILSNGQIYRPDRIIFINPNTVVLIDYKTGIFTSSHGLQLQKYEEAINSMGFRVTEKILVYFGDEINLKYV